jgi:hypothetical protein
VNLYFSYCHIRIGTSLVTAASDILSFNGIRLIIIAKRLVALRNINVKGINEETVYYIYDTFYLSM